MLWDINGGGSLSFAQLMVEALVDSKRFERFVAGLGSYLTDMSAEPEAKSPGQSSTEVAHKSLGNCFHRYRIVKHSCGYASFSAAVSLSALAL